MALVGRREEVSDVFNSPLLELVYKAASVHRMYNDPNMVGYRPHLLPGCLMASPFALAHPAHGKLHHHYVVSTYFNTATASQPQRQLLSGAICRRCSAVHCSASRLEGAQRPAHTARKAAPGVKVWA